MARRSSSTGTGSSRSAVAATSSESSRASSPEAVAAVKRAGTPYRELTEDEAMEIGGAAPAGASAGQAGQAGHRKTAKPVVKA